MILYLGTDPFSKVSQTDKTGPNAEINEVFFVCRKEKKVIMYQSDE